MPQNEPPQNIITEVLLAKKGYSRKDTPFLYALSMLPPEELAAAEEGKLLYRLLNDVEAQSYWEYWETKFAFTDAEKETEFADDSSRVYSQFHSPRWDLEQERCGLESIENVPTYEKSESFSKQTKSQKHILYTIVQNTFLARAAEKNFTEAQLNSLRKLGKIGQDSAPPAAPLPVLDSWTSRAPTSQLHYHYGQRSPRTRLEETGVCLSAAAPLPFLPFFMLYKFTQKLFCCEPENERVDPEYRAVLWAAVCVVPMCVVLLALGIATGVVVVEAGSGENEETSRNSASLSDDLSSLNPKFLRNVSVALACTVAVTGLAFGAARMAASSNRGEGHEEGRLPIGSATAALLRPRA